MGAIKDYYLKLNENRARIDVPEWGMTVYAGPLTMLQLAELQKAGTDSERSFAAIRVLAKDEKGFPALSGDDLDDMRKFGTVAVVDRVAGELMEKAPRDFGEKKA